ncbi:glutaminyl-peptide cyclotransferase [Sphingomonas sp.]|uniref:glutaminyl-peptide cyclotransferase n=1 Tax=Sphingomonas sp. TaxID=28214 RepID=UPI003B3A2775
MQRILVLLLLLLPASVQAALPVAPAQVVRTYPHDTSAFTEGLLIRDGWLYESTGWEGRSFIRQKELATGRTIRSIAIPTSLFGEGIVDWDDRLYSFVWHGGKGFIWTLPELKSAGTWRYTGEGWGMTHDDRRIIMSDGTPVLRFLEPGTMKVVRRLTVTADGQPVSQLNELEYVRGEILANVWQTALIARIDPATGKVKGWIDLAALWNRVKVADEGAVPNGIAYDKKAGRLFVTGKNWPTLFEIKLPDR